ncbi:hypothetical protein [Metallosphaera hakonensis]|uniref:hypothetical protein n=1 Tax=Metallosphaera hakonensis TaxID=79601 RepID=UPI000AB10870|nr:hypothetical protein [Metallosphaera hakonensis]
MNNVAIGKRPARSGLSQLIFNVGKVGLGILLIKFFYLDGIFMTYILAYLLQCVYLLRYVKLNLALTGNPASLIVKSLMLSVRNVRVFFEGLSNVIMESLHANAEALYGMAQQLSIPSTWPSSLNVATFSAVKEGTHHVNPILRSYLTIGSTITSLSVVFGFAFLSLFRQDYLIAVYPLLILSVANYVRGIYGILFNAMLGTDPSLSYESGSLNSITVRVELFYLVLSTSSLSIPFLLPRSLSTPTILIIVPLTFLVSSVIMSILLTRIVGRELSISIGPRELLINVVVLLIGSCILLPLPSIVAVPLATTLILLVQLGLNGHMRTIVKKRIDFIVFVLQQGNQQVKSLHSLHES